MRTDSMAGGLKPGSRKTRAKAIWVLAVVLGAWTLQGCTTILQADFDDLEQGQSPAGFLPGPPSGDSAAVVGVVEKSGGSVRLAYSPNQQLPAIDLITAGKPHNTSEYSYRLLGRRTLILEQPFVVIETFDTQNRRACHLHVRGGEFRLISGSGEESIGPMSVEIFHDVFMRLDRANSLCFVLIRQDDQADIQANGRPFIDNGFGDLDRLRVAYEGAGTNPEQYFLGPVSIEKAN